MWTAHCTAFLLQQPTHKCRLGEDPHLWAYILLFPFNIWLLEIVQGIAVMWFHGGYNVAWCYSDYSDVAFYGCLRLGHGVWWLGMGAALVVAERYTPFGLSEFQQTQSSL